MVGMYTSWKEKFHVKLLGFSKIREYKILGTILSTILFNIIIDQVVEKLYF